MSAAENLLWAHLSEPQTKELCETVGKAACEKKLLQFLGLDVDLSPEKQEILGNHLFYAFAFAKNAKLSHAAISTYLSIIKEIFENDVDVGYKSMDRSFDKFKHLVLQHSVDRSPVSVKVFERENVPGLVDNMTDTYYRHYRMYQYIFSKQETLELQQRVLCDVERVPVIAPLSEGILLWDQNDFHGDDVDEEEDVVATSAGQEDDDDDEVDETADDVDAPEDPDAGKAHLRAAKKTVQTLKSKIAEIRNYRVAPGKDAVRVLKATLYFLKYSRVQFHDGKAVVWDRLRVLLDDRFLSLLQNVDVTAVVKRPRYATLKRISKLIKGIDVVDVAVKSVAVAAILDWLLAAIAVKKSSLPKPVPVSETTATGGDDAGVGEEGAVDAGAPAGSEGDPAGATGAGDAE